MGTASTGQVSEAAAAVYEEFFVPALFDQWPARVLTAAGVGHGSRVLDVGAGTGVLARAASVQVEPAGSVTAIDPNDGMLTVARRVGSDTPVTWQVAAAEKLPYDDGSFDQVVSQFALMFFTDQVRGLQEMARVLRPGGRVAVATWARLAASPGYDAMVALLRRLFGDEPADALLAPFSLGEPEPLRALLEAEFSDVRVTEYDGVARFPSIEAWVHTEIRGWTLRDLIDDDQYAELLAAAQADLAGFAGPDGTVRFAAPALVGAGIVRVPAWDGVNSRS
jgi:SAM-dependent methyltransferase